MEVNNKKAKFKLDNGVKANIITPQVFKQIKGNNIKI